MEAYAVIETGGKQYRVTQGEVLTVGLGEPRGRTLDVRVEVGHGVPGKNAADDVAAFLRGGGGRFGRLDVAARADRGIGCSQWLALRRALTC